jgi:hypothetical protein
LKLAFAAAAVCLALSSAASAGYHCVSPVGVDTTNRMAWGSMATARTSANAVEYIQCEVYGLAGAASASVACIARNASGVQGYCSSTDPVMLDVIRAINDNSYLQFNWDASNRCTNLYLYNSSCYY